MKTWGQLKKEIRAQIWVNQEAENLRDSGTPGVLSAHDQHFQEAAADISKWSRCESVNVVNLVEFCKTFFKCGMTITKMPNGNIWRVFSVVGDDYCQPVFYREVSWPEVECLGRTAMRSAGTNPTFPTRLPLGFSPSDPATDNKCGRAQTGIWCKHEGNIYVAPYLQSVEKLVIEWTGVKTIWEDGDAVNEEQDYKLVVQHYCQFAHERDYGSPERSAYYRGMYDKLLAEIMWTCEEKLKVRDHARNCPVDWCRNLMAPSIEFETGIAPTPTELVVAHVGNIAQGSSDARLAVSQLASGITPSVIICSGNDGVGTSNYDFDVGQYWEQWIAPYYGDYGDGNTANVFWPAPGRGDWDLNNLSDWKAFFPTPGKRSYYDVCIYPIHFFFYDSEADELDGTIENSIQGQWLKARMMLSPSPWKVVVMYGNPYASGVPAGATWIGLNLPFKAWGASMVLSAGLPYYERLDIAGVPFIINGCGGTALAGSANGPIAQSQFISTGSYGVGRLRGSKQQLMYEFVGVGEGIMDSVLLEKVIPPTGVPSFHSVSDTLDLENLIGIEGGGP